jgi:hypothetical protein
MHMHVVMAGQFAALEKALAFAGGAARAPVGVEARE